MYIGRFLYLIPTNRGPAAIAQEIDGGGVGLGHKPLMPGPV